jgi:iron(III) transport system substrate-binding protein
VVQVVLAAAALVFLATEGCQRCADRDRPGEVVVYTSVDQVFSEPIFRAFENKTGIKVRAVFDTEETKSTGVLNRLIAEGNNPRADVFWSGDPVRPFLLIKRGLVTRFVPPNARGIPGTFRATDGSWTGFAARTRVLLVNKKLVPRHQLPRSIHDLADPQWKGRTAIANPLFGTTTMHVAALFAVWGDAKAREFLGKLKANNVRLASSNGEVKRLVVAGEIAFGLTDTDDAHAALKAGAPVQVVYPDQDGLGALVMPTTVVLLRGGPGPAAGRKMIEHLLSANTEHRMAMAAAHMPLRSGVSTPPTVKRIEQVRPMKVDYSRVAEQMEKIQPWLRKWVGL